MTTNIQTSNKKSKLFPASRAIENNIVLVSQEQLPHLFSALHSPDIKRDLQKIFKDPLEYEDLLRHYHLSFDPSQFPSEEAMAFIQLTERLRGLFRLIHSFNTINKPILDGKAA